ncbi:MAG: ArsR family transcriptional regulator [Proteobacteria bacterium]|nr:ArsR family transcriptional regulator [Pseudomonadota bacterium]
MRKLYHPKIEDITVEGILHALSDPVRVQIFMDLAKAECPQNCSTYLHVAQRKKPLAKSTLSQHFKVLREAGLIRSEREGVELKNYTRCPELKKTFGPMINTIIDTYQKQKR